MKEQIRHRKGYASDIAAKKVSKTIPHHKNPIKRKCSRLPLHSMHVGESIFIPRSDVSYADLIDARNTVWRINKSHGDIFEIIKHPEHRHDYEVMEIVRIK